MLNIEGLSRGSFFGNIIDKNKKIGKIIELTIDGNVLYIPEGITDIDYRLDDLLDCFEIKEEIKAVVLPHSLQTMDNFFYDNKSVELVIANSAVALTSKHNQGTFDNCNIRWIIAPYGFMSVDYKSLDIQVLLTDKKDSFAGWYVKRQGLIQLICTSFYRSHIECITSIIDHEHLAGDIMLANCYLSDGSNCPWSEIKTRIKDNRHIKMLINPIEPDVVLPEEFEDIKQRALEPFLAKGTNGFQKISRQSNIKPKPVFAVSNYN